MGPNTNLIFRNTFHRSTARKKFKVNASESTHWYFTIIVKRAYILDVRELVKFNSLYVYLVDAQSRSYICIFRLKSDQYL